MFGIKIIHRIVKRHTGTLSIAKRLYLFTKRHVVNKPYFCNPVMIKSKSIQLKAAFLLIVFSLNTIIGFACAVGINMGFNSHHHDDEATEVTEHIHADGKKHEHHEADHNHKSKDDNDNCCHDKVIKISQVDKAIPQPVTAINPVFFTTFISSFYNIDVLFSFQQNVSIKYFARSHHPPIPDIRIAIQSFQI